jgi:hypothetical protein
VLAENIVWTERASPRVLRAGHMPASAQVRPQSLQPTGLAGARTWIIADELQLSWPTTSGMQRLVAPAEPGAPPLNALILPLDEAFETRLDAARQFWRALNRRPGGTSYGALPVQTRLRHILNLRADDGRRAGAGQRRIAETLFSREPIASRDWRDHHFRHKVRAVLRRADRLIAGGYRDLLFYPHHRGRHSPT